MTDREFINSISVPSFSRKVQALAAQKYGPERTDISVDWDSTGNGDAFVDYLLDGEFKGHAYITRGGEVGLIELA